MNRAAIIAFSIFALIVVGGQIAFLDPDVAAAFLEFVYGGN